MRWLSLAPSSDFSHGGEKQEGRWAGLGANSSLKLPTWGCSRVLSCGWENGHFKFTHSLIE